jgi:hypothetical protein
VYFRKVISLLSDYTEYTAYTEYTDYADNTENTENSEYTEYPLAKILQTVLTLALWAAYEPILLIPVLLISQGANVSTALVTVACFFANEN